MAPAPVADPLPSWNDGPNKQRIIDFVRAVSTEGSKDFVPPAERIAVFDNDGTLWLEYPLYTQVRFVFDRIRALAPLHPEWKDKEPYRSVIAGDMKGAMASGSKGLFEMLLAAQSGATPAEFEGLVAQWIAASKDERFKRPYTELTYQPMQEVLRYMRANGFRTFIVSGGTVDFMRGFAEATYGIPSEQVIGSRQKYAFEVKDGTPRVKMLAELEFNDDKEGKPIAIAQIIGKRPIAAFGNSDGDFQMLQWTTAGPAQAPGHVRAPRRRGARVRLRPQFVDRQAGRGTGPIQGHGLGFDQHEERLEDHFPTREIGRTMAHDFDLIVIGAGSGGVAASRRAASHGAKVAVIEASRVGGTCVIRGCVPKKLLMYAAHYGDGLREAAGYGWDVGEAQFQMPRWAEAKAAETQRLEHIYRQLLAGSKVELIEGHAQVDGPKRVRVGERVLSATHLLIASGAAPVRDSIPGIEHCPTSDDLLDLHELPGQAGIIGSGFIAVEFASILARLGVRVSLFYRAHLPLRGFDEDLRTRAAAALQAAGSSCTRAWHRARSSVPASNGC